MKVYIVKTLFGRFNYYLNIFNAWTGLKDNAQTFQKKEDAENKLRFLKTRCSKDEDISIIQINPNG